MIFVTIPRKTHGNVSDEVGKSQVMWIGLKKQQLKNGGTRSFFMLFGWDMDSFLVQSVYFFTFHSPFSLERPSHF